MDIAPTLVCQWRTVTPTDDWSSGGEPVVAAAAAGDRLGGEPVGDECDDECEDECDYEYV